MRIFALGDPHLSFSQEGKEYKPMGIFGDKWVNHSEKIKQNWLKVVGEDDVVLIPGDISWAMELEEVKADMAFLDALPGKKIIIKGNHELWWDTISKVRRILPPSIMAIQNDHVIINGSLAICGTRGWSSPDGAFENEHDEKIYARELGRLSLSLKSVPKQIKNIIVMLHFPPTNWKKELSPLVQLLIDYNVKICLYGHLHGYAIQNGLFGEHWGIDFALTSADYLNFTPRLICEV